MTETKEQQFALEKRAAGIMCDLFGLSPVQVNRITRGVMTIKFIAELPSGERYVVRFYPPTRSAVVRYEPDIVRRCSEIGLPVPEIVCDSRNGPASPLHYMVYRMIHGVPLSQKFSKLSNARRAEIAKQIADWVYALEKVGVIGYGDFVDGRTAGHSSWALFLRKSFFEGIASARQHGLLPQKVILELGFIAGKLEKFETEMPSVLVWGGISLENIIIGSRNHVRGLLDFESALAGDMLVNLGYCLAQYHETAFFESLACAWPETLTEHHWTRMELYAVLRALRIVKFAHRPLPTGEVRTPIEQLLPGFRWALEKLIRKMKNNSEVSL
jgi:aminoglycoside phosphotransferase (APT) family kinase protein